MNLWEVPVLPSLYIDSTTKGIYSTKRGGLRRRVLSRWNRILVLRVSHGGDSANFTAGSLIVLAKTANVRKHWTGSELVDGWRDLPNSSETSLTRGQHAQNAVEDGQARSLAGASEQSVPENRG